MEKEIHFMNWGQFKDPLCYPYLAGAVLTSWSLKQEVEGSNKKAFQ